MNKIREIAGGDAQTMLSIIKGTRMRFNSLLPSENAKSS